MQGKDNSPREAFVAFLTINEGEILLNFGPGDHTCERWKISGDQLRLIVMDALPFLLSPSDPAKSPASF